LEANLRENKRIPEWINGYGTIPWDYDYVGIKVNSNTQVTDPNTGQTVSLIPLTKSVLFCGDEQRISAPVKVRTYDARTRYAVDDVELKIGCGKHATCQIGFTKYNVSNRKAEFIGKLPLCLHGYLVAQKDGYRTKVLPLTTSLETPVSEGIYLEQMITKNVTIKKIELQSTDQGFIISRIIPLDANDTVIVSIVKNATGMEDSLSNTVMFEGNNMSTVDLITGRYSLKATYMSKREMIVPKNCAHTCVERNWLRECTNTLYYPSENINLTGMPSGGIEYSDWTVYNDDLLQNNQLTIFVFSLPNPPCIDEIKWFGRIKEYATTFRGTALPQFV
jgi:hypothetical protein